jgi:hypothetical protein
LQLCNCYILNFLIYEENLIFSLSVYYSRICVHANWLYHYHYQGYDYTITHCLSKVVNIHEYEYCTLEIPALLMLTY